MNFIWGALVFKVVLIYECEQSVLHGKNVDRNRNGGKKEKWSKKKMVPFAMGIGNASG